MKTNLKCTLMLTAATLTFVATAAYGDYNALTAKIPFAFRAVGSDLPAGRYQVVPATADSRIMRLWNMDTGKGVFIQSLARTEESPDAQPRLIFQCGDEAGCMLTKLWSGTGTGLEFPTPALKAAQREHRETIYLERYK